MSETSFLRLASEKHAIKEAVISLFFASPIVKPRRFETLLNDLKDDFNHFEVAQKIRIQMRGVVGETEVHTEAQPNEEIGFRLLQKEDGQTVRVLQGENESNRVALSFHNLRYNRWDDFLETFLRIAKAVAPLLQNMVVIGFSLNYVDEVEWIASGPLQLSRIFQRNPVYLPENFFLNPNTELVLTVEDNSSTFKHYDRLQISSVVNQRSIVTIGHNIIHALTNTQDLSTLLEQEESIKAYLQTAHEHNKSVLASILQEEVQIKIGLKK